MICDSADDPKAAESRWVSTRKRVLALLGTVTGPVAGGVDASEPRYEIPSGHESAVAPADDVRLQEVRLRAERAVVTRYLDYVVTRGEWSGLYVLALCVGVVGDGLEDIAGRRGDGEVL